MKKHVLFAGAVALSLGSACASAVEAGQWYAGVSVGSAHNNYLNGYAVDDLGYDRYPQIDDVDTAFKLFGGYRVTRIWGVEFGFVDLGETEITGVFGGAPAADKLEASGLNLFGTATWSATQALSVFGKVGAGVLKGERTCVQFCTGDMNTSKTNVVPAFGGGVEYGITRQFGVRAELDYYYGVKYHADTAKTRYTMLSVGGVFKF